MTDRKVTVNENDLRSALPTYAVDPPPDTPHGRLLAALDEPMTDRKVSVADADLRRDALQKAYNGMCSVLGRLGEAGWAASPLARDAEALRAQLADVAFVHCVTCGWPARFHPEENR